MYQEVGYDSTIYTPDPEVRGNPHDSISVLTKLTPRDRRRSFSLPITSTRSGLCTKIDNQPTLTQSGSNSLTEKKESHFTPLRLPRIHVYNNHDDFGSTSLKYVYFHHHFSSFFLTQKHIIA